MNEHVHLSPPPSIDPPGSPVLVESQVTHIDGGGVLLCLGVSLIGTHKTCKGCQIRLELSNFTPQKTGKFGVTSKCRACYNKAHSEYQKKNRPMLRAKLQRWRKNNAERVREMDREYYRATREKRIKATMDWQKRNPGSKLLSGATYRANHADALKEWRRANRGAVAAHSKGRENLKRSATPKWLTPEQWRVMKAIYQMSARISRCTGIKHHVDHVAPLRSATGCGLHVPWNLQALPARINLRKKNSMERSGY